MKVFDSPDLPQPNLREAPDAVRVYPRQKRGMAQIDPRGIIRVDENGDIHIFVDRARQTLNLDEQGTRDMVARLVRQNVRGKTVLHADGKEERR